MVDNTPVNPVPAQPPNGPINKKRWGGVIIGVLLAICLVASFTSGINNGKATGRQVKQAIDQSQPTAPQAVNNWTKQMNDDAMQLAAMKAQKDAILDAALKAQAANKEQGSGWHMPAMSGSAHTGASPEHSPDKSTQHGQIALDFTSELLKKPEQASAAPAPAPVAEPVKSAAAEPAKKTENDFDSADGKFYRLFEGQIIETVLTNRLNGAFSGPVDCMVTTDVYSHDHQQLLIPKGTRILGQVRSVASGNQERLFVAFHRMIEPDGYSVSLDQFTGLNQVGETGLRDLVNHHYLQIFGASLALAAIGGVAQLGNGYNALTYDPMSQFRNGVSQRMAESSQQVLDRFLNRLPTFIIREGNRVKIWLSDDLLLPAYGNHTMDPSI